jgi:glycosyltransferase involved in cell wall biosynthesis
MPKTLHIHYCLTPTKYLYTQSQLHLKNNPLGRIGEFVLKKLWKHQRRWDLIASQRPDVQVAITKAVDERCVKYYGRRSQAVIYPPVDTEKNQIRFPRPIPEKYWLVVARLVPSKRIDLAIKAFNALGSRLVIIGGGAMKKTLKKIAKKNITFLGEVSDQKLASYYEHCQALVHPCEEDFGIVMVEALSAGKPVIAFKNGGASEIVDSGKHGILFDQQKVSIIMKSVQDCGKIVFNPQVLKKRASKFREKVFESEFEQFVRSSWQTYQKTI